MRLLALPEHEESVVQQWHRGEVGVGEQPPVLGMGDELEPEIAVLQILLATAYVLAFL